MLNAVCSSECMSGLIDDRSSPDAVKGAAVGPDSLPGDEVGRLIVLCEAPALLWRPEPAPPREPEPFGMIA